MNEHALDAMIYAWTVMKEKEENSMEGIFMGQINGSCSHISEEDGKRCAQVCFHDTESNACSKLSHYNKTYSLVLSDDVIKTNDELLKLRDEVKELKIQIEMMEAANADQAKTLLTVTKSRDYFEEKANSVEKKYEELVAEHTKLQAELTEIKTTRTLREAYIAGVEKGCESLREERDLWKRRWNSVVTDIGKSLEANGIEFVLKEIHGNGNWDVVIDIPELNEAKKKVADLEKKLAASKSKETFWRDRKEEEEDYHHYWLHTFDRAVKQAAEKGIHIGVRGNDDECNAGVVVVDNVKAEELKKQVVEATDRGDYWRRQYYDLSEYWGNTYNDMVADGKKVGVKIEIKGGDPNNLHTGTVYITNERVLDLAYELSDTKQKQDEKWSAMTEALKEKGVEVIYMGEEDGKPIVDVKIPEIDKLKKELETLKSRTLDNVEIRLSCGDIVWTYCDGFVHVSSGISGMISADEISTGTLPKCSSCAYYMHNPSRYAHDWCYMPVPKEGGAGYIRKLNKEEVEGPACVDFKARKE